MNAMLAVTRKPEVLKHGRDVDPPPRQGRHRARRRAGLSRCKYGEARHVARVLNEMFVGGGGSSASSSLDSASNQIAPGSGASSSASLGSSRAQVRLKQRLELEHRRLSAGNSGQSSSAASARARRAAAGDARARGASPAGGARARAGSALTSAAVGSGGGAARRSCPNVRITADPVNNTLLIYANQENYTHHRADAAPDRPAAAPGGRSTPPSPRSRSTTT